MGTQAVFPWIPTISPPLPAPPLILKYSCTLMYGKCLLMIPRNGKTVTAQISRADTLTCNARFVSQRPLPGPPTLASWHLACSGSFATAHNCNNHNSNGSSYCGWGGESAAALFDPYWPTRLGVKAHLNGHRLSEPCTLPGSWHPLPSSPFPFSSSPPTLSLPGERSCTRMFRG